MSKVSEDRRAKNDTTADLGFPTVSLEELARQQGVKPVQSLDQLEALWPAEFDPDEFLQWLAGERSERRKAVNGKVGGQS